MDAIVGLLGLVTGVLLGVVAGWIWRGRVLPAAVGQDAPREALAAATAERNVLRERVIDLEAAVSDDAQTASALAPLADTLRRVEAQVGVLERDRAAQLTLVKDSLSRVEQETRSLNEHTAHLAGSLRHSAARGTWGEVQLRRVLESAGMLTHCDFEEQVTATSRHGASIRPDVVVHLPGDKHLVIDAKVPMTDYLAAHAQSLADTTRNELLAAHTNALRRHVQSLSAKDYWSAFTSGPEYVVMFVPGEAVLGAALTADPGLHEQALARKVVLASPATLLALLRTVAYTWQQEAVATSAQQVLEIGTELYRRVSTLGGHANKLGRSLTSTIESYNALVGTLESRVLVTARQLNHLGVVTEALPTPTPVTANPRALTASELLDEVASTHEHAPLPGLLTTGHSRAG